jgi:hypothetical protein
LERKQGCCLICGAPGQEGKRLFVCPDCASPAKIVLFCSGCRRKREFTMDEFPTLREKILKFLSYPVPNQPGLIIVVSRCGQKDCPEAPGDTTAVYGIRQEQLPS